MPPVASYSFFIPVLLLSAEGTRKNENEKENDLVRGAGPGRAAYSQAAVREIEHPGVVKPAR
jgi:hypothetical protein